MITIEGLAQGLNLRPATIDDLEGVYNVIATCDIADYGAPDMTLDDLRTEFQAANMNLEKDTWLVTTPEDRIVGYGVLEHFEHIRLFGGARVHPDYSGRGIGSYLLKRVEERAWQHVPLAAPGIRVTLNTGVASVNTAAKQLVERAGFQVIRHFWRMEIEMNEAPPQPEWAEGITVRAMRPGEERAVFAVDDIAFADHWGHMSTPYEDWEHWMVKRELFDPNLWFLAIEGDEIVGISLCKEEGGMGWVNTLGVLRPWRHKGVGMALLRHSFGEFYRRGWHTAGLGVDASSLTGATRLYERAGMHVARQFDAYQKELRAGKEPTTQTIAE